MKNGAASPVIKCSTHKNARAAWECGKCGKALCTACAAPDHVEKMGDVIRCIHCGGIAKAIMVERPVDPWWRKIPAFFGAILSLGGIGKLFVVAVMLLIAGFMAIVPFLGFIFAWIFYLGILGSFLIFVLQGSTDGKEKLPSLSDMGHELSDLLAAALRMTLASAIVWIPFLIYIFSSPSGFIASAKSGLWKDPVILSIVIVGIMYLPAAFILAALTDSALNAANPVAVFGIIMRAPGEYLGIAIFTAVVFFGNAALEPVLLKISIKVAGHSGFIMLLLAPVMSTIKLILPTLDFMVLGWFIHQNAELFDLPGGGNLVAAMPRARPMGQLSQQLVQKELQVQPSFEPPAALELESTPEEALSGSLKMGNDSIALESYRKIIAAGRVPELDTDQEMDLAQVLERAGDLKGAVHSYRRAVKKNMQDTRTPDALFNAARILHDGLGAKEDAKKLAKFLVDKFPGHELSQQAQRFLA